MRIKVSFLSAIVAFGLCPFSANDQLLAGEKAFTNIQSSYGLHKSKSSRQVLVAQSATTELPSKDEKSTKTGNVKTSDSGTNVGVERADIKDINKLNETLNSVPATSIIARERNENVLMFFNQKEFAPNGIRKLNGEYQFKEETAIACFLKPVEFTGAIDAYFYLHMREHGIKKLIKSPCPADLSEPGRLKGIDLLIVRKRDLASINKKKLENLIKLITLKTLVLKSVFEVSKVTKTLEQQFINSKKLRGEIISNASVGYGVLLSENSGSGVCFGSDDSNLKINKDDQSIDQTEVIKKFAKIVLEEFKAIDPVGFKDMDISTSNFLDASEIFLDVKRNGVCKYIAANSQELSLLIKGFERDDVKFSIHHHWMKATKADLDKSLSAGEEVGNKKNKLSVEEMTKALEEMKARLIEKQKEIELIKERRNSAKW